MSVRKKKFEKIVFYQKKNKIWKKLFFLSKFEKRPRWLLEREYQPMFWPGSRPSASTSNWDVPAPALDAPAELGTSNNPPLVRQRCIERYTALTRQYGGHHGREQQKQLIEEEQSCVVVDPGRVVAYVPIEQTHHDAHHYVGGKAQHCQHLQIQPKIHQ